MLSLTTKTAIAILIISRVLSVTIKTRVSVIEAYKVENSKNASSNNDMKKE